MTVQFGRVIEVQVDTIKLGDLDVSFRVVKTLKKEPNTCELTIFNLNKEHRDQLAQTENPVCEIKAGYKGREEESSAALAAVDNLLGGGDEGGGDEGVGLIFLGDVRDVSSTYEPPDWVTTLESGDGEIATQFARINRSFAKGTSLSTALREAARAMDIGIGNAIKKASDGKLLDAGGEFLNTLTLSGPAPKELDRLVRSAGLEWSIQDGVLQILDPGLPLEDVSIVLAPDSGLVGSPEIGNDGVARIRSLINSDIVPGRQIELDSKAVKGRFRAERCEYVGSKFDNDFYVDIEAKQLSSSGGGGLLAAVGL